jgi:hypothetical protein
VGNPKPANQTIEHWLDINAFARAAPGTWGDCGIGIARAPGFQNVDAVLSKRFNAGGERYVEIKAEAFNLGNHPSFNPPARNIGDVNTFGLITSTISAPRVIELALKLYF